MPTIYSTAADRATRVTQGPGARHELVGLVAAAVTIGIGLVLLARAQAPALAGAEQMLAAKSLVNLNEAVSSEALMAALQPVFPTLAERRFAAERIEAFLAGADSPLGARRRVDSVGALARLTVPVRLIQGDRRLTTFAARLAAERPAASPSTPGPSGRDQTLALFTASAFAGVKSSFIVRTPSAFRRTLWLAVLLLAGGFAVAHAWGRVRGAAGDPVVLPAALLLCGIGFLALVALRDPLRDLPLFARFSQGVAAGGVSCPRSVTSICSDPPSGD